MADLRHAFGLDDWRVEGTIGQTTLALKGHYRNMFGTGTVRLDRGTAWGERFDTAAGDIELEGSGLRIHRFELSKAGSAVRGDVRVGWDGTYNFSVDNLDGRGDARRVAGDVPDPSRRRCPAVFASRRRVAARSQIPRTISTAGRRTSSWRTRASATSMAG